MKPSAIAARGICAARRHITDPRALDADPSHQALRPKARVAESLRAGRDDEVSMHRQEHRLGGWHREGEPPRWADRLAARHGVLDPP